MSADGEGGTPIDLGHLAEQTFGSADLQAEVLGLFVRQSRACLEKLAAAPEARTAHLLLGSARGIGATAVAAAAADLEAVLLDGPDGGADWGADELARLRQAVQAAVAFIEARSAR